MHELRQVVIAVALAAAMVLAERIGRRERLSALVLVLLSIVWFAVDKAWEIAVLVPVSHSHGLTIGDLVGVAGLLRGGWLLVRRRRTDPSAPARRRLPDDER
jgi:hypothetical protein